MNVFELEFKKVYLVEIGYFYSEEVTPLFVANTKQIMMDELEFLKFVPCKEKWNKGLFERIANGKSQWARYKIINLLK
jgi:hypothetical protein